MKKAEYVQKENKGKMKRIISLAGTFEESQLQNAIVNRSMVYSTICSILRQLFTFECHY